MKGRTPDAPRPYDLMEGLGALLRVIAHEAGHAVVAWATPSLPAPIGISFDPAAGEASCIVPGWELPDSSQGCLDAAAFFLGGAAGETIAHGGFERLGATDLALALEAASRHRRIAGAPRRRARMTPFIGKLPRDVFDEHRGFLDAAYGHALRRIERHRDLHKRLRRTLLDGYAAGKLAFDAEDLAGCLGQRPA